MIMGAVTIGALLILVGVAGAKIWNLVHKGEKYNWVWSVSLFFLSLLAFSALFNNFMITYYAANQDEIYEPDYFEANTYYFFGQVMILLNLALTLGEIMISLGIVAFRSLGEARDFTNREKRGSGFFGQK